MRLKHVVRRCAAADPPRKRPTVTAVSRTSANTIGPYQYKWISKETYFVPSAGQCL